MRTRTSIELCLALVGITMLSGTSSCDDDLLHDPGFDMWCGDELCAWTVEYGAIEKVATWHELDEGALLHGPRTSITQYADITDMDADCIYFSLLADAGDDATLILELDFLGDGTIEYSHEIPADDWESVGYHITPPEHYRGVRFHVRMEGTGRAVIAQVRAQEVYAEECHAAPIEIEPGDDEQAELPPQDTGFQESSGKPPVAGLPSTPPQQSPSSIECYNMLLHRVFAGTAP